MSGVAWVHHSLGILLCAYLFMIAIVAVEASQRNAAPPKGWHYAAGWIAASILYAGMNWAIPDVWGEPDFRSDQTKKTFSRFVQPGKVDVRTRELVASRGFILDGALGVLIYVWLRNARRSSEALAKAEIDRAEVERKLIASQVEAVEAEVDPGLVFSTLEAIENTYERDRVAADAMLDELIAFLRAAIPKLRPAPAESNAGMITA
jgi:hypothetical protein